ncbi:MAG: TonB-dependent receptor [Rhodanobacteraceae bacterium]|mgnify:CR=1 FL=1|nr:TonB-dependent receptor [Xanthomonadales bacterium]MCP5478591.1 TonB-dependent receptor [Rhodanobacteraceae bacterium]HPF74709.1 TonB-dependent receptor [Xanthomonadaceae bacterium]HRY01449.1 TonB-dependent receptor [Xanthomonadaceae bacterium]
MKRSHLSIAIAFGLAVGLAHTAPVRAQDANDDAAAAAEKKKAEEKGVTALGAVSVTARKREETLQEVPIAVSAFTPYELERLNVNDIGDLDAQVPNLTIYAARGSNTTVTAYIRGIGQADPLWGVDPGVGIYLDDVYIARPQGALLDVFDVGRIEVLRGPQGTLYGKNTIGGAIKYVSRDLPRELEGSASVTIGNYNERDFKGSIGGALNDTVLFRAAVASMNRDGFGENIVTGEDVSDKDTQAARLQVGIFPSDSFSLRFSVDGLSDDSGVRGAKMLGPNYAAPGVEPLDDRYDVRNGMPNVNYTDMQGASMTAEWFLNDMWSFKAISAWRESDTETNIDFDTLQNPIADVKAFYNDKQLSQEFQFNYDNGSDSRGVMGLYWFDGEAGGQVLNNFFNALFGDTQGQVDTRSIAAYGDWTWDMSEQFSISAGARYTREKKSADVLNRGYSDGTYSTPISIAADFDDSITFTNLSPRLSMDYHVSDSVMLYGSLSRGFKSGGFNIRAQSVAVPRSKEPFEDEQVDSLELGSKMTFLEERLFLNAAVFYNKYKDIQLSVFTAYDSNNDGIDDAFFGDFTNAGKGTATGLELEWQFRPSEHWLINGNAAWLDTKYDEFISSGVNVADSQKFTNAPDFSGALNVEYRTPMGDGGEFSARVGYSYQSEVYPTTDLSEDIKQPGYGLVNAGIIWRTNENWSFSLQGTNLANKEYRTTGYNIPVLGILTGFYGAPRQYTLTARYEF